MRFCTVLCIFWFILAVIEAFGLREQNGVFRMAQTRESSKLDSTRKSIKVLYPNPADYPESLCERGMFPGDESAYWACVTQYALQTNWFPSPIAGLFYKSYLDWNGFDGFWQNGAVLETMANYIHYTGSNRYKSIFTIAGHDLTGLLHAYYPQPSFDDEGWYGVAYLRVYEVTGNQTYLDVAEAVYNWIWTQGWDVSGSCSGGIWFGDGHNKKITITNGQSLLMGAKLYRLLHKQKYLTQAYQQLAYLEERVINSTTYEVADSIDPYDPNCAALPMFNITYNAGMIIGGLVELYRATANSSHLDLAHNLAAAVIQSNSHHDQVLLEYCEWDDQCVNDDDARMFKGIFVRNLRYLMDISDKNKQTYNNFLQACVNSTIANAQCVGDITKCNVTFLDGPSPHPTQGPVFTTGWTGPFLRSDVIAQTSVLDLFISATLPGTECVDSGPGTKCDYDPPLPDIKPLECKTNPCPPDHACCTWDTYYSTCCMRYQTCYNGGCYPP